MLQKLLSSKNPEDLRAANRLIRDMVRRDDKRMQRLQKRLGELELIQNNMKLLSELLAHYSSASGEQETSLIKVCNNSYLVGRSCCVCSALILVQIVIVHMIHQLIQ